MADDSAEPFSLADLRVLEQGDAAPSPAEQPCNMSARVGGVAGQEPTGDRPRGSSLQFFAALPSTVFFLRRFGNLVRFLVAWAVVAVGLVGCSVLLAWGGIRSTVLGLVIFVVCEGAFAAFCFNVIRQAAEGESELPALPLTERIEDWWQSFVTPFFSFVGTGLLALAPVIVYCFVAVRVSSAESLASSGNLLVVGGLLLLGLFLWPMLVLSLVMGDVNALARVDRMAVTVARTAVPYCCTVLLVYGAAGGLVFVATVLAGSSSSGLGVLVVAVGARAFAQVAAMRAIGTYYHHFSDRFDWL